MGKDYKLVVGVDGDGNIIERTFEEEPEQFNPLCSLDAIEEHLRRLTALDKEVTIDDFNHSINRIYEEVYALRAYITGMEK
ncbi:hypothetical protein LCGC14_2758720 [marine sediment metagenome]|uniref:Uncharacterized protein n=1 Tax=marine sediment metagenome TaxID=412755 RepID=A0A0F8YZQ0_9ZZZZ